jgi:hypothetical protein
MRRPPHSLWLGKSNYAWRRLKITKLLFMQFSLPSRNANPLRSKCSPQHPILKHSQPMFRPTLRDHVSYSYRTIGKITIFMLYFLCLWTAEKKAKCSGLDGSPYAHSNDISDPYKADNILARWETVRYNRPLCFIMLGISGPCKADNILASWATIRRNTPLFHDFRQTNSLS